MQRKRLQVFISSTYLDLQSERQAAVEAILQAGHIPAGMELFAAGNEAQLDIVKRWIDESDVYLLILGGRYGSIEPTTGLSYTELEYDHAVSRGMPFFSVVVSPKALDAKVRAMGVDAVEQQNPQPLKNFRDKVLGRISRFYDDPRDIKLAISSTLADFQNRYKFRGWVSGVSAPETDASVSSQATSASAIIGTHLATSFRSRDEVISNIFADLNFRRTTYGSASGHISDENHARERLLGALATLQARLPKTPWWDVTITAIDYTGRLLYHPNRALHLTNVGNSEPYARVLSERSGEFDWINTFSSEVLKAKLRSSSINNFRVTRVHFHDYPASQAIVTVEAHTNVLSQFPSGENS